MNIPIGSSNAGQTEDLFHMVRYQATKPFKRLSFNWSCQSRLQYCTCGYNCYVADKVAALEEGG